jgi:chromate transport protein ChrA
MIGVLGIAAALPFVSIDTQFIFNMAVSIIGIIFAAGLRELAELGKNLDLAGKVVGSVLAGILSPFVLVIVLLVIAQVTGKWEPLGNGIKQSYMLVIFSSGISFLIGYVAS